jgi:hypothetical protein
MLRSSSAMARRCSRFLLQTRGIVSSVGGGRGGTASGTRRPSSPSPLPSPSAAAASPADKEEWWAVDGELFKAEKFDPKQILSPLENEHISNKKRRKDRIKHLAQTRLKFRTHVSYNASSISNSISISTSSSPSPPYDGVYLYSVSIKPTSVILMLVITMTITSVHLMIVVVVMKSLSI